MRQRPSTRRLTQIVRVKDKEALRRGSAGNAGSTRVARASRWNARIGTVGGHPMALTLSAGE